MPSHTGRTALRPLTQATGPANQGAERKKNGSNWQKYEQHKNWTGDDRRVIAV